MAGGDAAPLEAAFNRWGGVAYSFALAIVREPAEAEAVLEAAFSHLFENAQALAPLPGPLSGKILLLTRHLALERVRGQGYRNHEQAWAEMEFSDTLSESDDPGLFDKLPASEGHRRAREAFLSLPHQQRYLLEAAWFEGETRAALAARFKMDVASVEAETRAAMETFRERLADLL